MAIGEFGGAPAVPGGGGVLLSTPLYWLYEMSHAALNPARAWADATRLFFKNPVNPLSFTTFGKSVAAACRTVRALDAPLRPARMAAFPRRWSAASACRFTSRPCGSGRSAGSFISSACSSIRRGARSRGSSSSRRCRAITPTLLRGTVEAFLPNHDVYITEWVDARMVPLSEGQLRSRRLHRLSDLDPARARRRHARGRRVPAVGAGAGRGRADGGRRRSLRCRSPWC